MKIIECPRDAMQGLPDFIPTEQKVRYLNALLRVGFHTLDFGSFVSPKAIPQMRDTAEVLAGLENPGPTKLLAIAAGLGGAERACSFPQIDYLGFPLSISETFQQRNTRKSVAESLEVLVKICEFCEKGGQKLVVYLSMAFGNPYGEECHAGIIEEMTGRLSALGIGIVMLSDTVGTADKAAVKTIFAGLPGLFPEMEIGAHFHSNRRTALRKIEAAYRAGCRRFDGAIGGFGGCPFAKNNLTGNVDTTGLLKFFEQKNIPTGIDKEAFARASRICAEIFPAPPGGTPFIF